MKASSSLFGFISMKERQGYCTETKGPSTRQAGFEKPSWHEPVPRVHSETSSTIETAT